MPANFIILDSKKKKPNKNNFQKKINNNNKSAESKESESKEMRLQVYLAHSGIASRRASEQIILDGRVTVNGTVVQELGVKVKPGDVVEVDGLKVQLEETKRYVLLNKPAGFVCSLSDEKNRPVAADLLKEKYTERLYNVGRLDMYSKGMILFTNDGDFAAKLSHPSSQIEKEYIVETSQDVPVDFPERFQKGIRVEDSFYKCKRCEILKARKVKIVLIEGKNREIRTVLDSLKIGTKSLVRVRIGCVNLDELKPGDSRDLTSEEVRGLLNLCN